MKTCYKHLLLLFLALTLFTSCKDDIDDIRPQNKNMLKANEFIYRALNNYYLYKEKTPELADDYFSNYKETLRYLGGFDSPEALFKELKYENDRFSVLVEDYEALENALQGKKYSTGAFFFLFQQKESTFLLVRNILANSNADKNKVVRGDVFHSINGQTITTENVNSLLESPSLTLEYAYLQEGTYQKSNDKVQLQNSELEEPSIAINKVLDINGQKIGYLMYNSFLNAHDQALNNAFRNFKQAGVTDLVLDLRYNTGGSIYSAELLSNMITGQFKGKVLYESEWNKDLNPFLAETVLFTDKFKYGESIESLKLQRVVILTQPNTASASELVINALNPYIEVIQVGTATRGKYQGSIMLYDSPNFAKKGLNNMHRYAMLPLVLKLKNAAGYTDFDQGLLPSLELEKETISHIKNNLGTPQEFMLRNGLEALGIKLPPMIKELDRISIDIPIKRIPEKFEDLMYHTLD